MGSSVLESFYPEAQFGGFSYVDGTIRFYLRVNAIVEPTSVVLDVGCGRGSHHEDPVSFRRNLQVLQGKCHRVIGIDVDPDAATNPLVDEFRLIAGHKWPVDDASVDLCVSDFVLEHVPDPEAFFHEAARVLKVGGCLCLRTPNAWGYESLIARVLPERWHIPVLRKVQASRSELDVFSQALPLQYRGTSARHDEAA